MTAVVSVISDAELLGVIAPLVEDRLGPRTISTIIRRPGSYRSSLPVEEVDVVLESETLELILKDLSEAASLLDRPAFAFDPRRSIRLHQGLFGRRALGTAEYWGSIEVPAAGRYWLLLERVPGVPLDEAPFNAWIAAARWLGQFHAAMHRRADELHVVPLARYDEAYLQIWLARAISFAGSDGDRRIRLERLAATHAAVVERLVAMPVTVIHGDFHASNVLIAGPGSESRVCVLDWELAALGPPLLDVAALVAGNWIADQRATLVEAYTAALELAGGMTILPQPIDAALDACRFQHAMQWLGWARDWEPPSDQARDWLAEAEALAVTLEL